MIVHAGSPSCCHEVQAMHNWLDEVGVLRAAPVLLAGSNESFHRFDFTAHVGPAFLGQLKGVGQALHIQRPLYPTPRQISCAPTHHPPAAFSAFSRVWQAYKCRGGMTQYAICSVYCLISIQIVLLGNVMTLIKCRVQSI